MPMANRRRHGSGRHTSAQTTVPPSIASGSSGPLASASPPSAAPKIRLPWTGLSRLRAMPYSASAIKATWPTCGVVSWPRMARPTQARKISSAPSASVRP
ncbi:hypothetical protein D3C72_1618000 [compost metagenome]